MKKLLLIAFVFIINESYSQPIFDKWTAIKEFHEVLSQTFHPAESGNLEPIKTRSEELMNKASNLLKLDIPEDYRTNSILSLIEKLQTKSKLLHQLVLSKGNDDEITKSITEVHMLFHEIVGLCNEEEK